MPPLLGGVNDLPATGRHEAADARSPSNLTDRARGIIREAAAASKAARTTRIEVNGYADTSGSPQYNQGLSMRRAQTVAAELVRNGVGKQEIAIKAFGETVLLVPTGDGVREPQNRRVEIIIR